MINLNTLCPCGPSLGYSLSVHLNLLESNLGPIWPGLTQERVEVDVFLRKDGLFLALQ